jgi:hypothetical protein
MEHEINASELLIICLSLCKLQTIFYYTLSLVLSAFWRNDANQHLFH